ncbi:hypothetical protein PHET_03041 [Paragonimus heterotremus]|uniref:Uncharacterized protein n=1 Tax=Paragonimus heterotremus TaxID=100268 RepID=A0A8J4T0M3_9TREM|nr:hypothetical protein PHET_03041 [Paragonimus heterotremus]
MPAYASLVKINFHGRHFAKRLLLVARLDTKSYEKLKSTTCESLSEIHVTVTLGYRRKLTVWQPYHVQTSTNHVVTLD